MLKVVLGMGVGIIAISSLTSACAYMWDLSKDTILPVSVTNNHYLTEVRLRDIESALFSVEEKNQEFAGWQNALDTINDIRVPILILQNHTTNIQITLVNYPHPKGYNAYTALEYNGRLITKATITIYVINRYNSYELGILLRHEMGHALGLEHSSDPTDLMYKIIPYYSAYISQDNISNIRELYR